MALDVIVEGSPPHHTQIVRSSGENVESSENIMFSQQEPASSGVILEEIREKQTQEGKSCDGNDCNVADSSTFVCDVSIDGAIPPREQQSQQQQQRQRQQSEEPLSMVSQENEQSDKTIPSSKRTATGTFRTTLPSSSQVRVMRPRREIKKPQLNGTDSNDKKLPVNKRQKTKLVLSSAKEKKRGKRVRLITERSDCRGPCNHCGITESPQWRKGPTKKPMLCNACGTRYLRYKSLKPFRPRQDSSVSNDNNNVSNSRKREASRQNLIHPLNDDYSGGSSGTDESHESKRARTTHNKRVSIANERDKDSDDEQVRGNFTVHYIADALLLAVAVAIEEDEKELENKKSVEALQVNKNAQQKLKSHNTAGTSKSNSNAKTARGTSIHGETSGTVRPKSSMNSIANVESAAKANENASALALALAKAHDNEVIREQMKQNARSVRFRKRRPPNGRYIGVTCAVNRKGKTWQARIRGPGADGRERAYVHLGMHSSPEAAARAFDRAAIVVHGLRRAVLNFALTEYVDELDTLQQLTLPELASEYRSRPHRESHPDLNFNVKSNSDSGPGTGEHISSRHVLPTTNSNVASAPNEEQALDLHRAVVAARHEDQNTKVEMPSRSNEAKVYEDIQRYHGVMKRSSLESHRQQHTIDSMSTLIQPLKQAIGTYEYVTEEQNHMAPRTPIHYASPPQPFETSQLVQSPLFSSQQQQFELLQMQYNNSLYNNTKAQWMFNVAGSCANKPLAGLQRGV